MTPADYAHHLSVGMKAAQTVQNARPRVPRLTAEGEREAMRGVVALWHVVLFQAALIERLSSHETGNPSRGGG